jgi:hypothetical protein
MRTVERTTSGVHAENPWGTGREPPALEAVPTPSRIQLLEASLYALLAITCPAAACHVLNASPADRAVAGRRTSRPTGPRMNSSLLSSVRHRRPGR